MFLTILSVSICSDDQEKLIPYLMEKFQEYQPLILEFLSNMRKSNQFYAKFTYFHLSPTDNIIKIFFFYSSKDLVKNQTFINTIA